MANLNDEVLNTRLRLEFMKAVHPELHEMYSRVPSKMHASLTMKLLERCITLESILRGFPFASSHENASQPKVLPSNSEKDKLENVERESETQSGCATGNHEKALHPAHSIGEALGSSIQGFTY